MQIFKTSALALLGFVTCLLLLLTPDSDRSEPPVSDRISINRDLAVFKQQDVPAQTEPVKTQSTDQEINASTAHNNLAPPVATTVTVSVEDWPLILYPELARIIELENLNADMVLGELLPMLSASDPVVRLAALESLADMHHSARTSIIATALDDPEAQIRVAALEALAIPDDASAWTYIEPYLYDAETEVRIAAIEALAVLESEQAIHSLAGLIFDQDRRIRNYAVSALGEIGGETAESYLSQARFDPDETIRANAEAILAERGYKAAY